MNALETARREAGYSQCQFAAELGLAQSTYCQYETGARAISAEIATKICSILGVAQEDIFLPKSFTVSKI